MILAWLWRVFGDGSAPGPAGRRTAWLATHRRSAVLTRGRAAALTAHRRIAAVDPGRTANLATHRRTCELAK